MTKSKARTRRFRWAMLGGTGIALIALPATVITLATGSQDDGQPVAVAAASSVQRGSVVSATRVARMSAAEAGAYLTEIDPRFGSPRPRNGVDTYRVVYRTISPTGAPTTASGVISLPRNSGKATLRPVSFAHGTHVSKNYAGSVAEDGQGRAVAIYYAAAGYAGVAPDYLGLGLGPGPHPYMHSPSEASASLDMLRAARSVAAAHGGRFERRVLVTGFSQGGVAAMALGRELQRGADPYLRLGALAPISGPFDLRHAQIPESFRPGSTIAPKASVFYLAYATVAWNRLYGLYESPSEVFRAPYDKIVEGLFDGTKDQDTEVMPRLPDTPQELLTPSYQRWALHPSGKLLQAIRSSDGTCDWRPRVPVRLSAGSHDEQVASSNTRNCAAALRAHGAAPQVIDFGPNTQHMESLSRGVPATLRWFR
ncbi:alpha/beta fold hydrolase [Actinomadura meridiana]|uniref:Alpha/beta fold hydrolase n=1 Tax=Actinomadura meridiana TaxID=559626 RepID=A0ABP8C3C4_9ACTN